MTATGTLKTLLLGSCTDRNRGRVHSGPVLRRTGPEPAAVLTGSGLNSIGAGSLQLQMLPYPSTLLQKSFLLRFSSVSAQWHSASADPTEPRENKVLTLIWIRSEPSSRVACRTRTFSGGELYLGLQQNRVAPGGQSRGLGVSLPVDLT